MSDSTGDGATQAMAAAVAELWTRYRDRMIERVDVLERAVLALLEGQLTDELRRDAEQEAHRIAGAVGTFGFAEGSRIARRLEAAFEPGPSLTQADAAALADLVVALRAELSGTARAPVTPAAPAAGSGRGAVLIVEADREFAERLGIECTRRGLSPHVAPDADAAVRMQAELDTDVIVLGLATVGAAAERVLDAGCARQSSARLVVVGSDGSMEARVRAARLGAHIFLAAPIPPARVLDAVAALRDDVAARAGARILALDDDPAVLAAIRTLLEPHGFVVTTLQDPREFWSALDESAPDLLITDIDMPNVDGVDVCRTVRNDVRWNTLPVVVLTARTDARTAERAFAAGADDFMTKPLVGADLSERINARLHRLELSRRLRDLDDITGAGSRAAGERSVQRMLGTATRAGAGVALAFIEIDDAAARFARLGRAGTDRMLRRMGAMLNRAFGEDVVAYWGGGHFMVAMYDVGPAAAAERLNGMLQRLGVDDVVRDAGADAPLTYSAGLVRYPDDGADVDALLAAAAQALTRASAAGGGRVVMHEGPGATPAAERVDIVVVEDDTAVVELLLHSLRTRGYSTEWLRDGQSAIDRLTGAAPALRARAVLLDVGLPGRDGLSVLRELNRAGVTLTTRVVMLTARSAHTEVLRALELGAFDHVAKPFSVPVLMERLRRALEPAS